MANKVRLGIIGLGAQGSMYAGFIQDGMVPNIEIGAICDVDPAKAQVAKSKHPGVPFYEDYVAMLESGDVDGVVTCVPHYLHPEMGTEALRRNVHALVEKPAGCPRHRRARHCSEPLPQLSPSEMPAHRQPPWPRQSHRCHRACHVGHHLADEQNRSLLPRPRPGLLHPTRPRPGQTTCPQTTRQPGLESHHRSRLASGDRGISYQTTYECPRWHLTPRELAVGPVKSVGVRTGASRWVRAGSSC